MGLTISLAQMDIVLGNPDANLQKADSLIAEAARRGSDLIMLPEMWTTGYDWDNLHQLAGWQTEVVQAVGELARKHHLWLTGSMLAPNEAGQPSNAMYLFNPQGETVSIYRKIHLFGLMDEDKYLAPGDSLALVSTPWGQTGLAVCYDLRFAELFRTYALSGAGLILIPAEWPHPRLAHWRTLLRARAIENQLYVAAVNRVGRDNTSTFCGHSVLIDPWGETIVEGGETEVLLTATLDMEAVLRVRQKIPVFRDRRPTVYQL